MLNKIKNFLIILCVLFLTVVVYQNKSYFFSKTSFTINLFFKKFDTPDIYNIVICFFFGAICFIIFLIMHTLAWYKEKQYVKLLSSIEGRLEEESREKEEIQEKTKKLEEELLTYKNSDTKKE